MRTGEDPGAVFDALVVRGQIRLHPTLGAVTEALATEAAECHREGRPVAVVVDTRDQAASLGAAIRGRLVAAGRVDDARVVTTRAGQRIGIGDRIATRRNDRDLEVANRDTWTVVAVSRHGALVVTPAAHVPETVTPSDSRDRLLPADYVNRYVELAYASTAHGVQGDTVPAAHLAMGDSTGAATAYVGMTRGRQTNIAHLVTEDITARVRCGDRAAGARALVGDDHPRRLLPSLAPRRGPHARRRRPPDGRIFGRSCGLSAD